MPKVKYITVEDSRKQSQRTLEAVKLLREMDPEFLKRYESSAELYHNGKITMSEWNGIRNQFYMLIKLIRE